METALEAFELGPARRRGGLVLYLARRRQDGAPAVVAAGPEVDSLSGPGLPPVVATGDGWVAFAQPSGQALAVRLVAGPLRPWEALWLGIAVGRVLAILHHREEPVALVDLVGPSAVFQGPDGQFRLDLMAPPLPMESPYRAPEVAGISDGPGESGPAADVYSLAALVYHGLTGTPPAPGQPLRLSEEAGYPPELVRVLTRALAADPAQRPTAVEMVQAFRSVLYRAPLQTAAPSVDPATGDRPRGGPGGREPGHRHPGEAAPHPPVEEVGPPPLWVWAAVGLAGALAGVAVAWLLSSRPLLTPSGPPRPAPSPGVVAPVPAGTGGGPETVQPPPGAAAEPGASAGPEPPSPPAVAQGPGAGAGAPAPGAAALEPAAQAGQGSATGPAPAAGAELRQGPAPAPEPEPVPGAEPAGEPPEPAPEPAPGPPAGQAPGPAGSPAAPAPGEGTAVVMAGSAVLGEAPVQWLEDRLYIRGDALGPLLGLQVRDEGDRVVLAAGDEALATDSFRRTDRGELWIPLDSRHLAPAGYAYLGAAEAGGSTTVYLQPLP